MNLPPSPGEPEPESGVFAVSLITSISEVSKNAYAVNWDHFVKWCRSVGRTSLPASEETLLEYIDTLSELSPRTGVATNSPATITRRLTAINAVHQSYGYGRPSPSLLINKKMRSIKGLKEIGPKMEVSPQTLYAALAKVENEMRGNGLAPYRDRLILLLRYQCRLSAALIADLAVNDILEDDILASMTIKPLKMKIMHSADELTCIPCTYFKWRELIDAADRGGTLFVKQAYQRVRDMGNLCMEIHEDPFAHASTDRNPYRKVMRPINKYGHVEPFMFTEHSIYSVCRRYIGAS